MYTLSWWIENYFVPLSVALSSELIILIMAKYFKKRTLIRNYWV